MTKPKNSFCVKVISSIVVFTFLTLNITSAHPLNASSSQTLAAENAFQAGAKDFNGSILSQAPVLNSVLSIGNYLLEDTKALPIDKRLEALASVIGKRSSISELNVQSKIKFAHVKFHPRNKNVVVIPYEIEKGNTVYVQIAFVKDITQEDLAGFKWTISDKSEYAITILPKDYDPNLSTVLVKNLGTVSPKISKKSIAKIEIEEAAEPLEPNALLKKRQVVVKAITLSLLIPFVIPFSIWSCATKTVSTISTPTTTSESRPAPKEDVSWQEFDVENRTKKIPVQSSQKPDTEGLTRVEHLGIKWMFVEPNGSVSKSDRESWNLSDEDVKNLYGKLVYLSSDLRIYRIYIGGKENCVGCMGVMFGKVSLIVSYKNAHGNEMWISFGGKGYVSISENKKSLERRYGKYVKDIKGNNETGQFTGTLKSSFGKAFSIAPDEKDVKVLFDYRYGSISGMIQTSDEFRVNAVTGKGGQLKIHEDVGFFEGRGGLTVSSEFTVLKDYDTGIKNVKYWGKAGEEWYVINAHKDTQSGKIILEKGSQAKLIYDEFQLTTSDILINTGQSDIKIKQIRGKNKLKPGKAGIIFGGELCVFENERLNREVCVAVTYTNTRRLTELINLLKTLSLKKEKVNETFDKMLPGYSSLKRRPTFLKVGIEFAKRSDDKESAKLLSSEPDFLEETDLTKLETAITYVSFARLFNSIAYKLTQGTNAENMVYLLNILTGKTHTDIFSTIREITNDNGFSGLHAVLKVQNLLQNINTTSKQSNLLNMFDEIVKEKNKGALLMFTQKVQSEMGTNISYLEVLVRIIEFDFMAISTQTKLNLTFFNPKGSTLKKDALKEHVNVLLVIHGYSTSKKNPNNSGMITPDMHKHDSTYTIVSDAVNRAQKPTNKTYALFESVTRDPNNTKTVSVNAGNDIADFLSENEKCELPPIDRNAATAEVVENLKQTLTALDTSNLTLPEEIETAKNKIKTNLSDMGITGMLTSIEILARAAKRKNKNLVIGIDPSWIPGYEPRKFQHNAMNPFINELTSIRGILKKRGLKNVSVFIKGNQESVCTWADKMEKALDSPGDFSNLIVIGSMDATNYIETFTLKGIAPENRAVLAEINPVNLNFFYKIHGESEYWQLNINLIDLISITVDLANGKSAPDLKDLQILIDPDNPKKITYILSATRIDYQKNVKKNNLNKTTLRSL